MIYKKSIYEGRFSAFLKIRLHSQIIYGDSVETFDPYYRGYMKDSISLSYCINIIKTWSRASFFHKRFPVAAKALPLLFFWITTVGHYFVSSCHFLH